MTEQAQILVANQIRVAFADLPIPKAKGLTIGGHDAQAQKATRAALKGQHWSTIPRAVLAAEWAGFCYLTPEAYRFYLPALLLAALEAFPTPDQDDSEHDRLVHSVVWNLVPSFWQLYYRGKDAQFDRK